METGRPTRQQTIAEIAELLTGGRSVLLVGEVGIGKSHLARQIARRRDAEHVEVLLGSPAIQKIPFGAAAHVVPDRAVSDPLRLLQLARRELEERAGARRLLLVIDDVNLLDEGTLALVHQMAASGGATVLATVREEAVAEPAVEALWKDDHLGRRDLGQLTRAEHDRLVEDLLGEPAPYSFLSRLWDLTQGNPLFAREVVLALGEGADTGAIADAVFESTRLRDYASKRLADLSEKERALITTLSLTEPLDASLVEQLFDFETIEDLQRRELIAADRTEGVLVYRTSHPLLAELVRARVTDRTRAELLGPLIAAAVADHRIEPSSALRVASWSIEAGLPLDPEVAVAASLAAQRVFDGETAMQASTAALDVGRTVERLICHGSALSLAGRIDEADEILDEAAQAIDAEIELGALTSMRAINLVHRGGQVERGTELLHEHAARFTEPAARAHVESLLMQAEGLHGDFRRALDLGPELARAARGDDIAELRMHVSLGVARAVTGHHHGPDGLLDAQRGIELANTLSNEYPVEADQMMLNSLLFDLTRPDITAALALIEQRLQSAAGAGEGPWLYMAAWVLSVRGDISQAYRAGAAAVDSLRDVDPIGLRPLALGALAVAEAHAGRHGAAAEALAEAIDDPRSAQPRCQMFTSRARAWLAAHRETAEAGARIAVREGHFLHGVWHQTWGAWTAYDAVRLGHAELALDYLAEVAAESDDGAVRLFRDHAAACSGQDAAALEEIAAAWRECGAIAHAAEAFAHAALAAGDVALQARNQLRALLLQAQCRQLESPVLNAIEMPVSERELEIARRAAAGESSRDIAEELFISRRTVDNHLGAVYSTLGLSGRGELADLFGITRSAVDRYLIAV